MRFWRTRTNPVNPPPWLLALGLAAGYMFFGVGLKVTRANAPAELREFEMPMKDQLRTLRRLHTGTIVNLVLTIYAYALGVTMV